MFGKHIQMSFVSTTKQSHNPLPPKTKCLLCQTPMLSNHPQLPRSNT